MTAQSIQTKIDKAHKKIAQKLGYDYSVYRPLNDVSPLDERNMFANVKATFTLNDTYTKTIGWEVPIWTVYTDPYQLLQGDFLSDGTRTFFILSRLPHLPVLAIETPDTVDIKTVGYGNSGTGFAPAQSTLIARSVPAFISTSSTNYSGSSPGSGAGVAGFRNITVITYLRAELSLNGMTVTARDDFVGDIIKYDFASLGTAVKFTAQEFQG